MVGRDGTAERAAGGAEQRAEEHHEKGHREEVREEQAGHGSGDRAREQSLPDPRLSQRIRILGACPQPGRRRAGQGTGQERSGEDAEEYQVHVAIIRSIQLVDGQGRTQPRGQAGHGPRGEGRVRYRRPP